MKLYLTDPTSHREGEVVSNLGDIIIKDAVLDNLPAELNEHLGGWVPIDFYAQGYQMARGDLLVLAGANIIANSPFRNPSVWRPALRDAVRGDYLVLFGIGWWQYQKDPGALTGLFYRHYMLRSGVQHSVRDSYTKTMLEKCGIGNVINTGCPTMWKLPEYMSFGSTKPDRVVFTLTDYYRHPEYDRALLQILLDNYKGVHFFPQGSEDINYLHSIATPRQLESIVVLERTMEAYNSILASEGIDYVGTRLHAGIRALQKKRRAFVLSVDNRATEISKDTNLPVLERKSWQTLTDRLYSDFSVHLRINHAGIEKFKDSIAGFVRGIRR
jgi:hypothetical protein